MQVWNPSFDVTSASLLTGIITEQGLVPKGQGSSFSIAKFLSAHGLLGKGSRPAESNGDANHNTSSIPGFYALDLETVKDYLADRPDLARRIGSTASKSHWQVSLRRFCSWSEVLLVWAQTRLQETPEIKIEYRACQKIDALNKYT